MTELRGLLGEFHFFARILPVLDDALPFRFAAIVFNDDLAVSKVDVPGIFTNSIFHVLISF